MLHVRRARAELRLLGLAAVAAVGCTNLDAFALDLRHREAVCHPAVKELDSLMQHIVAQAAEQLPDFFGAPHTPNFVAAADRVLAADTPALRAARARELRYFVALLLLRKRQLRMVDPKTEEQERAEEASLTFRPGISVTTEKIVARMDRIVVAARVGRGVVDEPAVAEDDVVVIQRIARPSREAPAACRFGLTASPSSPKPAIVRPCTGN